MNSIGDKAQVSLIIAYVFLTLPCLTLIGLSTPALGTLWLADVFIRAVPFVITHWFDKAFSDGGELSPQLMPLWILLTGIVLWPMIVLGIRPTLWQSRTWRNGVLGYASVAVVGSVGASIWLYNNPIFF